jgi:hypothetical protein
LAVDLTPLEQAAARAGLPGLHARIVAHERRRGRWFEVRAAELLVSERVLERCPPQDACALLVDELLLRRRLRVLDTGFAGTAVIAAPALLVGLLAGNTPLLAAGGALLAGVAVLWPARRARAAEVADDEAVTLLGDATPLVRGLNGMDCEELHVAGKRLPARPGLHRRAERLVRLHRLCSADAAPPA